MTGYHSRAAVMFADMRGFTGMAERLPPAQVFELLNEFFGLLTAIAVKHGGVVFNVAGDCLMVGFGVPKAQADCGACALRAARDMLVEFADLAGGWRKRFNVETGLGIGINVGEVVAGKVGANGYGMLTLIGDTVNVAARLGQRARAGEVLFSQALKQSLDASDTSQNGALALPPMVLRGRSNPIDIFCMPTLERPDIHH